MEMLKRMVAKCSKGPGGGHPRRMSNAGFTLVEMLVALLIMSLMTGLVAVGISISTDIYKKEQFSSQSQVLLDTIESALSDPLRFAQPNGADTTKAKIVYRNNDVDSMFINPNLQARNGAKATRQVLYLSGDNNSEGVPLLNEGIYGDCSVSVEQWSVQPKEGGSCFQTTAKVKVQSTRDSSLSLERTFTFDSQPGVSKVDMFGVEVGDGGDVPVDPPLEREGTDAPEHLYGGSGTAEESGFPEYSSGIVAANKQELGAAMVNANRALSELSGQRTQEQVDALRSAISSAMAVMVNLRDSQGDVDAARDALNEAISTFRNASSGGDSGGGESGGSSGGSSGTDELYSLRLDASWDGNKNYSITFKNPSSETVSSLTVELTAHGNVTGIDGNVTGEPIGNGKWRVTFNNYNNPIGGNVTLSDIYMHVTGTDDFSLS